jgi:hypothetical protein
MRREWNIGEHKAWFDENKSVLYLKIVKEFERNEAKKLKHVMAEAFDGMTSGRNALIILNESVSIMKMTKENRDALKEEFMAQGNTGVDKYAIVGASPSLRMLAKMIMRLSGVKDSAFFKTEEEALKWFSEGHQS